MSVTVEVDSANRKKNRIEEILGVVWDYFTEFWEAFVALFFGALLFVIRKYTKKKTGYYEKPNEMPTLETPPTTKEIEEEVDHEVSEPEASSTDIEELPESNEEEDE